MTCLEISHFEILNDLKLIIGKSPSIILHRLSTLLLIRLATLLGKIGEFCTIYVQDFYKTTDWSVQDHTARFEEELAWLNTQVTAIEEQGGNGKVVILTHYSPSLDERAVDPRHCNSHI